MNDHLHHLEAFTVFAYAEGLLTQEEEAEARSHLDGCPACRARLSEEQAFTVSLRSLELPAPADLSRKVGASLRTRRVESRGRRLWWLAAVVLLVASGAQWLATGLSPGRALTSLVEGFVLLPERLSHLALTVLSGAFWDQVLDLVAGAGRAVASSPESLAAVTGSFVLVAAATTLVLWYGGQRLLSEVRR